MADNFNDNDYLDDIDVDDETLREVELASRNKRRSKRNFRPASKDSYSLSRRKQLLKYKIAIAVSWVLLAVLVVFAGFTAYSKFVGIDSQSQKVTDGKYVSAYKPTTLFFLHDDVAKSNRSVIILTKFNSENGQVTVSVLPEEVTVPAGQKSVTLEEQYEYGGVLQVKRAISEYFGITVDKCLDGNFSDMEKILEKIGEVEYNIDSDMNEVGKDGTVYCDLTAGKQSLTPPQIFSYLRFNKWNSISEKSEKSTALVSQTFSRLWTDDFKSSFLPLYEDLANSAQTDISTVDVNDFLEHFDKFKSGTVKGVAVSTTGEENIIGTDEKQVLVENFK